MSRINEKLGIRPAGRRRMMKLPADRIERNRLTSAICPICGHAWHVQNVINGVLLRTCAWCSRTTGVAA